MPRELVVDVQTLAEVFLEGLNTATGKRKRFDPATLVHLRHHRWPGNVREVRHYVERAFALADEVLDAPIAPPDPESGSHAVTVPVGSSLAAADRKLIMATLERCGGVKKRAAGVLGISLKTLYNRLEQYRAKGEVQEAANEAAGFVRS